MDGKNSSTAPLKTQAKALRKYLAEQGVELGHSKCLEAVARTQGFKNWDTASARVKGGEGVLGESEFDARRPAGARGVLEAGEEGHVVRVFVDDQEVLGQLVDAGVSLTGSRTLRFDRETKIPLPEQGARVLLRVGNEVVERGVGGARSAHGETEVRFFEVDDLAEDMPAHVFARYDCLLPVSLPGNDLRDQLKHWPPGRAFLWLAKRYDAAAAQCRRVGGVLKELSDIEIRADGHDIVISASSEALEPLRDEGVLQRSPEEQQESWETKEAFSAALPTEMTELGLPFSLSDVLKWFENRYEELCGLNPAWVRLQLENMTREGLLQDVGDGKYVVKDESADT